MRSCTWAGGVSLTARSKASATPLTKASMVAASTGVGSLAARATTPSGLVSAAASGAGDGLRRETATLFFGIDELLHFFEQRPHFAGRRVATTPTGHTKA